MRIKQIVITMAVAGLFALGCAKSDSSGDAGGGTTTPAAEYTISVNVSGLPGSLTQNLVLQNNGADDLTVSANGTASFSAKVSSGSAYSVTVKTHPATASDGYGCTVSSGSGTATADVTVNVTCATNPIVISSTPANGAKNVATCESNYPSAGKCQAKLEFTFNENITTTGASLKLYLSYVDNTTDKNPQFDTTYEVTQSATPTAATNKLTYMISWIRFPENAPISVRLSGVQDSGTNAMSGNYDIAFLTAAPASYSGSETFSFPPTLSFGSAPNAEYTTTDQVTNAIWRICPVGVITNSSYCDTSGPADTFSISSGSASNLFNACVSFNNTTTYSPNGLANRATWRVATRAELLSIHNPGAGASPYIYSSFGNHSNSAVNAVPATVMGQTNTGVQKFYRIIFSSSTGENTSLWNGGEIFCISTES